MKVLCIKNNSKLVKGAIYDVLSINTLPPTNGRTHRPNIRTSVGLFSANYFKSVDNSDLPQINWEDPAYTSIKNESSSYIKDVRTLKKGDIVVCKWGTSKFFEKGKMYKVSDILYKVKQKTTYNGATYSNIEQKIKIEGYNRWLMTFRFRECNAQEKRNISLSGLFDEEVKTVDLTDIKKSRKIDRLQDSEKNRVLLTTLLAGIMDPSRNTLSSTEWAAQKKGKKYDIIEKDFQPLLNKKLSDIIKMFD
jgi:hypothetical protein